MKLVSFETLDVVSYSLSIVTAAISCIVYEIASYWSTIAKFLYPTCISTSQGVTPLEFREDV